MLTILWQNNRLWSMGARCVIPVSYFEEILEAFPWESKASDFAETLYSAVTTVITDRLAHWVFWGIQIVHNSTATPILCTTSSSDIHSETVSFTECSSSVRFELLSNTLLWFSIFINSFLFKLFNWSLSFDLDTFIPSGGENALSFF